MEGVVEICPVEAFHYLLELLHAEVGDCPIQYVLEICPKIVGIWVVLMLRHIIYKLLRLPIASLVGSHPFKSLFEVILANSYTNNQVLPKRYAPQFVLEK